MSERDSPRTWPDTALEVVSRLLPKTVGSIKIIYDDCRGRKEWRVTETITAIAEETGLDTLRQRLADPEIEAMFLEGLDVATRTGLDAKRRLLARVIAQAVNDDAKIEDAQLITMALRDLDAPHIRALVRIRAAETGIEVAGLDDHESKKAGLAAALAASRAEPLPVVAALIRTGVVHQHTPFLGGSNDGADRVSDFGLRLLDDLAAVAHVAGDA